MTTTRTAPDTDRTKIALATDVAVPDIGVEVLKAACKARGIEWRDEYAERVRRFVASDDRVDRYGEIVEQDWQLGEFQRNPVIITNHDRWKWPIGVSVREEVGELIDRIDGTTHRALFIDVLFASAEHSEEAEQVFGLVKAGFVRTCSVGFRCGGVVEAYDMEPAAAQQLGLPPWGAVIKSPRLTELSICTIPANVGAELVTAAEKAVTRGALRRADADYLKSLTAATPATRKAEPMTTGNDPKMPENTLSPEMQAMVKSAAAEAVREANEARVKAESEAAAAKAEAELVKTENGALEVKLAKTEARLDVIEAERRLDGQVAKVKAAGSGLTDAQIREKITAKKSDEARDVVVEHLVSMAKWHQSETDDVPADGQTRLVATTNPETAAQVKDAVKAFNEMRAAHTKAGKTYERTFREFALANFAPLQGVDFAAYGVAAELLQPKAAATS